MLEAITVGKKGINNLAQRQRTWGNHHPLVITELKAL